MLRDGAVGETLAGHLVYRFGPGLAGVDAAFRTMRLITGALVVWEIDRKRPGHHQLQKAMTARGVLSAAIFYRDLKTFRQVWPGRSPVDVAEAMHGRVFIDENEVDGFNLVQVMECPWEVVKGV